MVKLSRLKAVRESKFLSLSDLATKAGVSKTTIVQLEALRVEPHPRTVRKLAEALEVEPKELL